MIERHARAVGGLPRLRQIRAGWTQSDLAVGGLEGKVTSSFDAPLRLRSEIDLSVIHVVQVLDHGAGGGTPWIASKNWAKSPTWRAVMARPAETAPPSLDPVRRR